MNIRTEPAQTHGRPTNQTRVIDPFPFEPIQGTARQMGEKMREILCRDGSVTDAALIAEGFTTADIIEYGQEAKDFVRFTITSHGAVGDRVAGIIDKAVFACAGVMPSTAGTDITDTTRIAWNDYCTAMAAFRLDPWISQQERCLNRLRTFLGLLPLLPSEANRITTAVAAMMKRRANAGRGQ